MGTSQQRIAVYGKGGIGKSVVATNLSASFALEGQRVLHIGCDPKRDSAFRLMKDGEKVRTVLEVLGDDHTGLSTEDVINEGRLGISCCESGGPPAGLGCGGRGVARTIELLEETEIMHTGGYDAVLFDVLGDVVCGGFAAPLRQGFAEKVIIVTSEEPMALYAANNIARAVHVYSPNGIVLAGLVANRHEPGQSTDKMEKFAQALSTRILQFVPRNPVVMEAERKRQTVVEYAPDTNAAKSFRTLARTVAKLNPKKIPLPTPMEDDAFYAFLEAW